MTVNLPAALLVVPLSVNSFAGVTPTSSSYTPPPCAVAASNSTVYAQDFSAASLLAENTSMEVSGER